MIIISKQDYEDAKQQLADLEADITDLDDLNPGGRAQRDAILLARSVRLRIERYELFERIGRGPFTGQAGRTL